MSYEKQNFTDGEVLTAAGLNRMEDGVEAAHQALADVVGRKTAQGGEIFGDYETNKATAPFGTAFGSETKALGKASFSGGLKKDRSGAPDEPAASDWRYNEAIGEASMAFGMGAVAFSRASKSFGYRTQTGYPPSEEVAETRPEAIVQTDENGAPTYPDDNVGQAAVALGADTAALANHSLAGGLHSVARGNNALAFGNYAEANGYAAVALGNKTKANGNSAVALGSNTEANGQQSTAIGSGTKAEANWSFAAGYGTTASENAAFAAGKDSIASGRYTVAMGWKARATNMSAAAFGSDTEASGQWAFTSGACNNASGNAASALGYHLDATALGQLVGGKWNKSDSDAVFVVGNGTSEENRKNAFTVKANGNARVAGELSFGSMNIESLQNTLKSISSSVAPTKDDEGRYKGQLWIQHDGETGSIVAAYIYLGCYVTEHLWAKIFGNG